MSTDPYASLFPQLYGAYFFGTMLSTAFYGVSCMQTSFYYVHYQGDPKALKAFVGVVWALNTIHEALGVTASYKYIMAGLVNPLAFATGNPEVALLILPTILVTVPCRGFFAYRLYSFLSAKYGKRLGIIAPLVCTILAIIQLVTSILYVVKALYTANGQVQLVELLTFSTKPFLTLGITGLAAGVAVDILIAISMTWLLLKQRVATRFASTAEILQRLIVFSVNNAIWPATFSLSTIILMHVESSNMLFAVPYIPLCSVYCNTLLANLNARMYISGAGSTHIVVDGDMITRSGSLAFESAKTETRQGESRVIFASQQSV